MHEFDIINRYFNRNKNFSKNIHTGPGDDAAIVLPPKDEALVVTIDNMVEGCHFFSSMPAHAIGYRSLAISLSDLAAMGANPAWCTIALTIPQADHEWLNGFSEGLFLCADKYKTEIIGGNIAAGQVNIASQATGYVNPFKALLRSNAKVGDSIYVSNTLGDAAAAVKLLYAKSTTIDNKFVNAYYYPEPQLELGKHLINIASAAIDISDGLLVDLRHILTASNLDADIDVESIPMSQELVANFSKQEALDLALSGGDDYQLCFTVAQENEHLISHDDFTVHKIGKIIAGNRSKLSPKGWKHFNAKL